jgi:hypothetical protein
VRRVMFTVAATVLMAGAVPASALAHHHGKHHARHHARIRRFGDQNSPPTSMSPSDNAGKVADFSNGVLTIQLNDGSTVKGAVTNDTELECTSTQSSQTTHEDGDGGSGGDQSSGDNQGSGDNTQGDNDQNEAQGEDNDQGEDQNENQSSSCSTSSLTPGAVVHEASLRIGGSGAAWQKVELVS